MFEHLQIHMEHFYKGWEVQKLGIVDRCFLISTILFRWEKQGEKLDMCL